MLIVKRAIGPSANGYIGWELGKRLLSNGFLFNELLGLVNRMAESQAHFVWRFDLFTWELNDSEVSDEADGLICAFINFMDQGWK